jgi:hypothetical protein
MTMAMGGPCIPIVIAIASLLLPIFISNVVANVQPFSSPSIAQLAEIPSHPLYSIRPYCEGERGSESNASWPPPVFRS